MNDEKKYDNRTQEEIEADLESRRKDHVLMTTEEAIEWNKKIPLKPPHSSHWTIKKKAERAKMEAMIEAIHKSYETDMASLSALCKHLKRELDQKDAVLIGLQQRVERLSARTGLFDLKFNP